MSLIITRPMLDGGLTRGGNPLFATGVIFDALLVQQNFAEVYEALNGNLHGNNVLWPLQDGQKVTDSLVKFPEYGSAKSAPGQVHSHDGFDSAPLGQGAVNMDVTQYRSFGAWMFPSSIARQVLIFGSAKIEYLLKGAAGRVTFLLDLPFTTEFGFGLGSINTRAWASLRTSDPEIEKLLIDQVFAALTVIGSGANITNCLHVQFYVNAVVPGVTLQNTYIDWFVVYYPQEMV